MPGLFQVADTLDEIKEDSVVDEHASGLHIGNADENTVRKSLTETEGGICHVTIRDAYPELLEMD